MFVSRLLVLFLTFSSISDTHPAGAFKAEFPAAPSTLKHGVHVPRAESVPDTVIQPSALTAISAISNGPGSIPTSTESPSAANPLVPIASSIESAATPLSPSATILSSEPNNATSPANDLSSASQMTHTAPSPSKSETATQTPTSSSSGQTRPTSDNDFLDKSDGPWKTVRCDDAGLSDDFLPAAERWRTARVPDFLSQLFDAYNEFLKKDIKNVKQSSKSMDSFFANSVRESENSQCWLFNSRSCTTYTKCDRTVAPAVWLVKNSFVALNAELSKSFDYLEFGASEIDSKAPLLAQVFTEFPPERILAEEIIKVILDTVFFAASVGSGFVWSVFIKKAMFFKDDDYRGGWKDTFGAVVGFSLLSPKNFLVPPKKPSELAPFLTSAAQFLRKTISQEQASILEKFVRATTPEDQKSLQTLLGDGAMLRLASMAQESYMEAMKAYERLFYGSIIPTAWKISPVKLHPFILRIDRKQLKCGDSVIDSDGFELLEYMTDETRKKTQWCDKDGNSWFLLNAMVEENCERAHIGDCLKQNHKHFEVLPGGDHETLNGQDWGGIRMEDIIQSSFRGFEQNDLKNGYGLDLQKMAKGDPQAIFDFDDYRTPGFFNFRICLDHKEAVDGIDHGRGEICGERPKAAEYSPPEKAGYTSGFCGVHVTQFQKGKDSKKKNSNSFSDLWQLEVAIKDQVGKRISLATKQPLNPAYIVKGGLPREMVVAVGDEGGGGDQVCFWYSDQHWCTSDKVCNLGKFEDGKRELDCGFTCVGPDPLPPPTPRVDRTRDAPEAFMGRGNDPETFGTAPKSSSYNRGWCGVHIRQYQRNEEPTPNPDYGLEISLYDARQNMVDYVEKSLVPPGEHVGAQGPLEFQLSVYPGGDDETSLTMKYGGDEWTAGDKKHHCREGRFDEGVRDIDCGFSC